MRAYLIGFAASLGLVVALAGAPYLVAPARSPSEIAWLITLLLALPTCAAWVTIQAIHTVRPRRLFDPRVNRPELALFFGAASGLMSFAWSATWLAYDTNRILDIWIMLASAAAASGLTVLLIPRVKRGRCAQCGEHLARIDLCHECGTPTIVAASS